MSKLFWAMLSFITRLPIPRRWSQGLDFEHYSRGIITFPLIGLLLGAISGLGNDSNLLIVFYVQIMPDDFVMQLHRF